MPYSPINPNISKRVFKLGTNSTRFRLNGWSDRRFPFSKIYNKIVNVAEITSIRFQKIITVYFSLLTPLSIRVRSYIYSVPGLRHFRFSDSVVGITGIKFYNQRISKINFDRICRVYRIHLAVIDVEIGEYGSDPRWLYPTITTPL